MRATSCVAAHRHCARSEKAARLRVGSHSCVRLPSATASHRRPHCTHGRRVRLGLVLHAPAPHIEQNFGGAGNLKRSRAVFEDGPAGPAAGGAAGPIQRGGCPGRNAGEARCSLRNPQSGRALSAPRLWPAARPCCLPCRLKGRRKSCRNAQPAAGRPGSLVAAAADDDADDLPHRSPGCPHAAARPLCLQQNRTLQVCTATMTTPTLTNPMVGVQPQPLVIAAACTSCGGGPPHARCMPAARGATCWLPPRCAAQSICRIGEDPLTFSGYDIEVSGEKRREERLEAGAGGGAHGPRRA